MNRRGYGQAEKPDAENLDEPTPMPAIFRLTEQTDALGIPWDLREWVDSKRLLEWIDEDNETLEWNHPKLVDFLRANPAFRPKIWLRLLTYGYSTGVYGSDDLISSGYGDEPFRTICNGVPPTRYELATFRRENRGLLKWFLVQIFKRVLKERFGQTLISAGLKQRLIEAAVLRIDLARDIDRNTTEP
jgi:transposase